MERSFFKNRRFDKFADVFCAAAILNPSKRLIAVLTQDDVFRGREKLRSVRQLVDDSDFIIVPITNDHPEDIIDAIYAEASPAEMSKSIEKIFQKN